MNDLVHLLVAPRSEGGGDEGCAARVELQILISIPHTRHLLSVVLHLPLVLLACQGSNPWRPQEQSQNVLTAPPALSFLVRGDLPLPRTWHHMLKSQLPCDNHLFGQMGALDGDIAHVRPLLIHALRMDHTPQLQTFAYILPLTVLLILLQLELLCYGHPQLVFV